jgi:hypothetical protein
MKVLVKGSELTDADIHFISLVKRGANRSPFKVIKAEDVEGQSALGKVASGLFAMSEPDPSVVGFFIKKGDNVPGILDNLKKSGFKTDGIVDEEGMFIAKQDGFADAKSVVIIKLDDQVGVAVQNIKKYADTYTASTDFDDNVVTSGFYPGISQGIGALQNTLYNIASEASGDGDYSAQIQAASAAFAKYVTGLFKSLPKEVWKFESLQRAVGGSTVQRTVEKSDGIQEVAQKLANANDGSTDENDISVKKEDEMGNKADQNKGDVQKDNAGAAAANAAAGDAGKQAAADAGKTVEKTAEQKAAEAAAAAAGGDGKGVEKQEDKLDLILKSVMGLQKDFGTLTTTVQAQGEELKKTGAELAEIKKTASTAIKKAEGVTVHVAGAINDSAYDNLGGPRIDSKTRKARGRGAAVNIEKAQYPDELWANGILGALEQHVPGEGQDE